MFVEMIFEKKKQDWFFKPQKNRLRDQHFG